MRRALMIALLTTTTAAVATPARGAATRVSVAVVGDSIVESGHLAVPDRDGLVPRLRGEIARRGLDAGAAGYVSAHPGEAQQILAPRPGKGSWIYNGSWAWLTRWPGVPADLFSWTDQGAATATLTATAADEATVLYLAGPAQGRFAFTAGASTVEVDAHRPTIGIGSRTLRLRSSDGEQRVAVAHVDRGGLGLIGAYLRRAPRADRVQVEVTPVARGGARAADTPAQLEDAGLAFLKPAVTVIVMGTNDGIGFARSRDPAALSALRAGLVVRGRRARGTGACLMVPPARSHFPAVVFEQLRASVTTAARTAGCELAAVMDALDRDPALTIDGVHPSSAGYARLARALTPRILALAAEQGAPVR